MTTCTICTGVHLRDQPSFTFQIYCYNNFIVEMEPGSAAAQWQCLLLRSKRIMVPILALGSPQGDGPQITYQTKPFIWSGPSQILTCPVATSQGIRLDRYDNETLNVVAHQQHTLVRDVHRGPNQDMGLHSGVMIVKPCE
jgi:hypothetical protein